MVEVTLILVSNSKVTSGGFEHGDMIFSSLSIFHTKILCYNVAKRDRLTSTYQHGSQSQLV